ncbi:MAG: Flagellar motor switch protein FliG [Candidatus Marinimicrobia bacterium]|nr:Flagellar motor switch protein FliG [Candidatus Neomarinimicrobiota bacterium]
MANGTQLTGTQKAAILFKALGYNLARSLFKDIGEDEVARIQQAMNDPKVQRAPFQVKKQVLEEFYFGFIADKVQPEEGEKRPFRFLSDLNDDQIVYLLQNETARVRAIAVAQLDIERQVSILQRFESDEQADILMEMGKIEDVPYEGVVNIAANLHEKAKLMPSKAEYDSGGAKGLADVLTQMDARTEKQFLHHLEQESPDLAQEIKRYHLMFEDIVKLPDDVIREVLKEVEPSEIAYSLKGQPDETREKFVENMPERAQIILEDEMRLLEGPQPRRKVESAQKKIVAAAKKLEEEGRFSMEDFVDPDYIE